MGNEETPSYPPFLHSTDASIREPPPGAARDPGNMKTRFLLFAAVAAMALSFAGPAQAHDRHHHDYYRHHNYYQHGGVIYHRSYGFFRPAYPVVTGPVLIIRP